jgi:hypothetical protein
MTPAVIMERSVTVRIFFWPLLLAVLSGAGLIFALLGDGAWDAASWVLLATPIAAVLWGLMRPSPPGR